MQKAAFSGQLREKLGVSEARLGDGYRWIIAEGPRVEAYLASKEVAASFEELMKTRMPYSLGLFAGSVRGMKLQVSLELASHLAQVLPPRKIILLKTEAEQPILYGRDVLAGSIHRIDHAVARGELVVLANLSREVLALGEMLVEAGDLSELEATHRVVRNLIDKGWYLRKGG